MTELNDLYRYAVYYDIVFGRDVDSEVDFLIELVRRYRGRPPSRVVDLGCGPGYHARTFARRGLTADRARLVRRNDPLRPGRGGEEGIDGRLAGRRHARVRTVGAGRPCRMSVRFDRQLVLDRRLRRAFPRSCGQPAADGLYVIGQSHQRDTSIIGYGPFHYEAERNGCRVRLDWATDVTTDTLTQTADVEIVIQVNDHGVENVYRHRTVELFATPVFLIAAARLSGVLEAFELVWRLPARSALRRLASVLPLRHRFSKVRLADPTANLVANSSIDLLSNTVKLTH